MIGPNGAGKTTLVSLATTLLSPNEGTLIICGIDARQYPNEIRKQIGVVPQHLALYEKLTGYENILYFSSMYGLKNKTIREKAHQYLEMFGLSAKSGQNVSDIFRWYETQTEYHHRYPARP